MDRIYLIPPTSASLNEVSQEVDPSQITSPKIQEIIDEMVQLACGSRVDIQKLVMVGLAAPQVGVGLRIVLVDMGVGSDRLNLGELKAFINPEIVGHSDEVVLEREGCFSTGCLCGIVPRFASVKVRYFDREGNSFTEEFTGFRARIFQHEIDHLDGIRFPDRLGADGSLHWVEEDERIQYRAEWENWHKWCPIHLWEAMKKGNSIAAPF